MESLEQKRADILRQIKEAEDQNTALAEVHGNTEGNGADDKHQVAYQHMYYYFLYLNMVFMDVIYTGFSCHVYLNKVQCFDI